MVDSDRSVIEVAFGGTRGPLFASAGPSSMPPGAVPADVEERSVDGRLVVVTGASGLLGASVAAELAGRGAHVCLIGRDMDALRVTVDALGPEARTAMLRCDLASIDDVDDAVRFIDRIGEPVDLLVHAAGMYTPTTIAGGSVDDLDEHYLLDVRGPYLLTQRLLPSLTVAAGRVVFFSVGSDADDGAPGAADVHRSISQAGLVAFASALRTEAGPLGVRVLTVRTEDDLDPVGAGAGETRFLELCAAKVLDALEVGALDVTELHLRRSAHRPRSERR